MTGHLPCEAGPRNSEPIVPASEIPSAPLERFSPRSRAERFDGAAHFDGVLREFTAKYLSLPLKEAAARFNTLREVLNGTFEDPKDEAISRQEYLALKAIREDFSTVTTREFASSAGDPRFVEVLAEMKAVTSRLSSGLDEVLDLAVERSPSTVRDLIYPTIPPPRGWASRLSARISAAAIAHSNGEVLVAQFKNGFETESCSADRRAALTERLLRCEDP